MKHYTLQMWSDLHQRWQEILSVPHLFESRSKAEERLHFEAEGRRCRLLNRKGIVVMHSGKVTVAQ